MNQVISSQDIILPEDTIKSGVNLVLDSVQAKISRPLRGFPEGVFSRGIIPFKEGIKFKKGWNALIAVDIQDTFKFFVPDSLGW